MSNNYKAERVNEEVRKAISNILINIKDPRIPEFPSVVSVSVSGDLKYAKVYISFLNEYDEKEVKQGLKAATGFIRKQLGDTLKLRAVPELIFHLDHSIETGARINRMLKDISEKNEKD